MSEEKQMYQETNERLLADFKKAELQLNIMQQQINANLGSTPFRALILSEFEFTIDCVSAELRVRREGEKNSGAHDPKSEIGSTDQDYDLGRKIEINRSQRVRVKKVCDVPSDRGDV